MTRQIIKQPDGQYAIFDSEAQEIVYFDLGSLDMKDAFQVDSDDGGGKWPSVSWLNSRPAETRTAQRS